ncbi:NAD(P)-binding domain-containing protein [Candidatus Saccharibacteria bacterium]|nr:NAD(P)-binding domain-containing protein [Candidatus Saccharibacteria bacterium]
MKKVTVIGAGAFALAMSRVLDRNGAEVVIWTKFMEEFEVLERDRKNDSVLPGIEILERTCVTTNIWEAVEGSEVVLVVVPSGAVRAVMSEIGDAIGGRMICLTTKGVETSTGMLMSQVVRDVMGERWISVLSGPGFAVEMANFLPTVITAAGSDESVGILRGLFENKYFKVEGTTDEMGVLTCGAFGGIYAIGAGILEARGAGNCALAAIVTRGAEEMRVMAEAVGGSRETVNLACGIGDLTMKCMSGLSRNRQFGVAVGEKGAEDAHVQDRVKTTEGYMALSGAVKLADEKQLHLPVVRVIGEIVNGRVEADELMRVICS